MSKVTNRKPLIVKDKKKTAVKPRLAANGYRLPDPLPSGEVLTDNVKSKWILGESIGCGGFGELYLAKSLSEKSNDYNFVIKVDHNNGPLYAEMHFYHRVAKANLIEAWMKEKGNFCFKIDC